MILLDTGPLVAYLKPQDNFHLWTVTQLNKIKPPLLTCEPVIVEACFLLANTYKGASKVFDLLKTGHLQIALNLANELDRVDNLMQRYDTIPMSLADACLVRMIELYPNSQILTLDSDFYIYRYDRDRAISLMIPG